MPSIFQQIAPCERFRVLLQPYASILIAFIVLSMTSGANAFPVGAEAYVRTPTDDTSQPPVYSDGDYVSNSAQLSSASGFGSASSRGAAGFGGVSAFITSDYSSSYSQARGKLSWEDNWLMSPLDIGLNGHQARVYPVLNLSGSGTAQSVMNSYTSAHWDLTVRVGTTNTGIAGGTWSNTDGEGVVYTGDLIGEDIVGIGFLLPLGYSTDVRFVLTASARTDCSGSCSGIRSASVDLSNTLNWVGLIVTDSNDQLIEDFTLTAGSGVDYTQPVPEPAAVPQALVALLALVFLWHHRC